LVLAAAVGAAGGAVAVLITTLEDPAIGETVASNGVNTPFRPWLLFSLIACVALRRHAFSRWSTACDPMQSPVFVTVDEDLKTAAERMRAHRLRELPVVTSDHRIVGMLREEDLASACLDVESLVAETRR
jgi:CBS domain-containing protein